MNQLQQIRNFSQVVADTGDIDSIKKYLPVDTTTNPSLILKAVKNNQEAYKKKIVRIKRDKKNLISEDWVTELMVDIGCEILSIIPGRVSIEIPANLSFDKQNTINVAKKTIDCFQQRGIAKSRILIKIAGTYEGIMAAQELEKEKIYCNITLVFSPYQALLAADRGITLISPFVGRVLDWYQAKNQKIYSVVDDPGVNLVKNIFYLFKRKKYSTEIMAASFRKVEQVLELVGCDLITIAPQLLGELKESLEKVALKLDKNNIQVTPFENLIIRENDFRWKLCLDEMAESKLSEGIRLFNRDYRSLIELLCRFTTD